MRGFQSLALPAVVIACLIPLAVFGCLNDRDINRAEKEFKSSYLEKAPAPASSTPESPETPSDTAGKLVTWGGGLGFALLIGAFMIPRPRQS